MAGQTRREFMAQSMLTAAAAAGSPAFVAAGEKKSQFDSKTQLHYCADEDFGDPIPFFWKGEYHLFYIGGEDGVILSPTIS